MRVLLIVFIGFLSSQGMGQDLTGIWRGSFVSSDRFEGMFNSNDRYKLEVQIDQQGKLFKSVTYSYKTTMFYGKAASNGTVNTKTGKVYLVETKIVEVKMSYGSSACIMTYFLQYSKNGEEEFLEGKWTGYNENDSSFCNKGTVILRKVDNTDFYKEPFLVKRELELKKKKAVAKKPASAPPASPTIAKKPPTTLPSKNPAVVKKPLAKSPSKDSTVIKKNTIAKVTTPVKKPAPVTTRPKVARTVKPVAPSPAERDLVPEIITRDSIRKEPPVVRRSPPGSIPSVLATRENELIKTIVVNHQNEITINIYDNGTIDHDTVSVYLDKKLVISKQMLTTSPLSVKFSLDEANTTHEIIMVAENLGDIPPNTSLMVVKAGDKEYEVRITSNEQKNAVVLFKLEE